MWNWLKRKLGFWYEGLDRDGLVLPRDVDFAEGDIMHEELNHWTALRHIAGIKRLTELANARAQSLMNRFARQPMYRLAAVRLLARQGNWDLEALRLYGWTGYQKHLLPHNPLFAHVMPFEPDEFTPSFSKVNQGELKLWLENASDDELVEVEDWYSQEDAQRQPELYRDWTQVLGSLGPDRLRYILKVIVDSGIRDYQPLLDAIGNYLKDQLSVSSDGYVHIPEFSHFLLGEELTVS